MDRLGEAMTAKEVYGVTIQSYDMGPHGLGPVALFYANYADLVTYPQRDAVVRMLGAIAGPITSKEAEIINAELALASSDAGHVYGEGGRNFDTLTGAFFTIETGEVQQ
jgi:hypothetical protein